MDIFQLTCLIHGPGNSSDECKVLNYFGNKYSIGGPFKEHRWYPTTNKKFGKKQEVNGIFQQSVDEIILQENWKIKN